MHGAALCPLLRHEECDVWGANDGVDKDKRRANTAACSVRTPYSSVHASAGCGDEWQTYCLPVYPAAVTLRSAFFAFNFPYPLSVL